MKIANKVKEICEHLKTNESDDEDDSWKTNVRKDARGKPVYSDGKDHSYHSVETFIAIDKYEPEKSYIYSKYWDGDTGSSSSSGSWSGNEEKVKDFDKAANKLRKLVKDAFDKKKEEALAKLEEKITEQRETLSRFNADLKRWEESSDGEYWKDKKIPKSR